MKQFEVFKDNNIYDISVLDDNRYLAGTMIDLNRNQYYLILPDKYDKDAVDFIINNIINVVAVSKYDGKKVGSIKTYTKELLEKELDNLGFNEVRSLNYNVLINNKLKDNNLYGYLR